MIDSLCLESVNVTLVKLINENILQQVCNVHVVPMEIWKTTRKITDVKQSWKISKSIEISLFPRKPMFDIY